MEHLFVSYNIALALKEKGFDEECFAWYVSKDYGLEIGAVVKSDMLRDAVIAPTYQQAIVWLFPKLEFNYPMLSIELFWDGSGEWYSPEDRCEDSEILNERFLVEFNNLDEAIEKVLEFI